MNKQMIIIFAFLCNYTFGQNLNNQNCKIEFYLLKSVKPNIDTTKTVRAEFSVNKLDLEDYPFIKNDEILEYDARNQTVKFNDSSIVDDKHSFKMTSSATKRVENLQIPLQTGRQFALVVNGEIVYSGYFWNISSSFSCEAITAVVFGPRIDILRKLPDYDYTIDSNDPRRNSNLFDCLTKTNRLQN